MYDTVKNIQALYGCLQDEQSKEIFWSRLAVDIEPSMTNTMKLCAAGGVAAREQQENWKSAFLALNEAGERIVLYVAGIVGRDIAAALQYEQIEADGGTTPSAWNSICAWGPIALEAGRASANIPEEVAVGVSKVMELFFRPGFVETIL